MEKLEITTADIQAQAILVNGRQLTLAVFRQIPVSNKFKEGKGIFEHIIGWVNYCPNGCNDGKSEVEHLHILFSVDGFLNQETVYPTTDFSGHSTRFSEKMREAMEETKERRLALDKKGEFIMKDVYWRNEMLWVANKTKFLGAMADAAIQYNRDLYDTIKKLKQIYIAT